MLKYPEIWIDAEYDPIKKSGSPIAFYHSENMIFVSGGMGEAEYMGFSWEQTIVHETTHWCLVMAIPKNVRERLWKNEYSRVFMERIAWEVCDDL